MSKNPFSAIRRHKIISGIIIIALGAGGYFMFGTGGGSSMVTAYTYATATTGTIMQTVSGTGQIEASKQTDIQSKVSGDILEIGVVAGQPVKAGDLIAAIDDSPGVDSVEDAKTALYNAQVSLDNILESADDLTLTKAKNSVTSAQKTLESDKESLSESYVQGFNAVTSAFGDFPTIIAGLQEIVTTANEFVVQSSPTYLDYYYNSVKSYDSSAAALMSKAASSYQAAKTTYDANFKNYKSASQFSSESDIEVLLEETYQTAKAISDVTKNVGSVVQNYEDNLKDRNIVPQSFADTQLSDLSGYTTKANSYVTSLVSALTAIDDAKDAIDSDQLSLEEKIQELADLQTAPDESEVKSARLAVAQKQRALDDARSAREDYTIVAPFDGTVASVDVSEGDSVSTGVAIATVITDNQIVTVSLNEVDIAKVKVGQRVTLAFDAVSDLAMTGKVAEVATIGSVSSGVVNYGVTITLDSADSQVKPGMSVSATIITDIAQDVLTVPSAAIKTADDGTYYVSVPIKSTDAVAEAPQQVAQQTVTTGLDDDTLIEIVSGLTEGDQVVVSTSKSLTTTKATSSSGGFFMGGMGGPRD